MAIENRDLPAGTRLMATYKEEAFTCTVEEDDGKRIFAIEDGRRFASPSAAGSAIMGGVACNGWRFWSLKGNEPANGLKRAGPRERRRNVREAVHPAK